MYSKFFNYLENILEPEKKSFLVTATLVKEEGSGGGPSNQMVGKKAEWRQATSGFWKEAFQS